MSECPLAGPRAGCGMTDRTELHPAQDGDGLGGEGQERMPKVAR